MKKIDELDYGFHSSAIEWAIDASKIAKKLLNEDIYTYNPDHDSQNIELRDLYDLDLQKLALRQDIAKYKDNRISRKSLSSDVDDLKMLINITIHVALNDKSEDEK